MCSIIDNDVRHEVFGGKDVQTEAGRFFFSWLNNRQGRLAVGGKLLDELSEYSGFRNWLGQALQSGSAIRFPRATIDDETLALTSRKVCKSNDTHVLALARVSGARLLFTNDTLLRDDFRDPEIISNPRGRIYSTRVRKNVVKEHRDILRNATCTP